MNLTKRNKSLLGVFFVGLIALAVDRTILRPAGGPGAASAAMASGGTELLSRNVPVLQNQPQEAGLAGRLDGLWSEKEPAFEQIRNPFTLPVSWFETPGAAQERAADAAARFIRTHQLGAVVVNGEESYALVDDRFLVPGHVLDGFTLVSIGDRFALFERDGGQAVLELINK